MKLCSRCVVGAGLTVMHPQLLKVYRGCDNCKTDKRSWVLKDIFEQTRKVG